MFNIKKYVDKLGLNYRKEKQKMILLNGAILIAGIGLFIFSFKTVVLLIALSALALGNYWMVFQYQKKIEEMAYLHEKEFVTAFGIFQIYVSNQYNVYQALQETSNYLSPWMKVIFEKLLRGIDEDKTITPYIAFAHNFRPLIIEQVMTSVFQMVDSGHGVGHLGQFSILFSRYSDDHLKDEIQKHDDHFESLNLLPLFGAGILAIDIVVGVVQIIGGFINEL
ncbi:MAG: hypothetical protein NTV44_04875 [Firmicutes bacterium]|nr:hypothetical protein [Bacillota bacterium]